jgi:site-specific recombinase XerD
MAVKRAEASSDVVFSAVSYNAMKFEKMRQILKASGCIAALERGATFHSFRHTFASQYMESGGDVYELRNILGHSTVMQTEQYAHFSPEFLSGATDRVNFGLRAEKGVKFGTI